MEPNEMKEVVDEFDSGFTGETVMRKVASDYVETTDDRIQSSAPVEVEAPAQPAPTAGEEAKATDSAKVEDEFDTPSAVPAAAEGSPADGAKEITVKAADYEALVKRVDDLTTTQTEGAKRLDATLGKLGGLEGFIKELQKATPSGEVMKLSDEEMKELRENYPTITPDLEKVLNTVLAKVQGTGKPSVTVVDDARVKTAVQDAMVAERIKIKQEVQKDLVLDVHPDFDQQIETPEFKAWFGKLPADHVLRSSWSAAANIKGMNEFKATLKPAAPPKATSTDARTAALAAAANPRGTPAPAARRTTEDDEFDAGYKSG